MRDGPFSAEQQRTIDDLTARLAIITKATTMLLDYLSTIAHDARERVRVLESVLEEKGALSIDELRRAVAVTQREERALFQLAPGRARGAGRDPARSRGTGWPGGERGPVMPRASRRSV
jgi:hypothetical protein